MTAAEYRKIECPFCDGRVEFSVEDLGSLRPCPNCHQEIILEKGPDKSDLSQKQARPLPPEKKNNWVAGVGILISLAGAGALVALYPGLVAGSVISVALAVAVVAFFIWLYFLPYLVASKRRHRNIAAIFIVNVFLGWTLIGWVIALVWAAHEEGHS